MGITSLFAFLTNKKWFVGIGVVLIFVGGVYLKGCADGKASKEEKIQRITADYELKLEQARTKYLQLLNAPAEKETVLTVTYRDRPSSKGSGKTDSATVTPADSALIIAQLEASIENKDVLIYNLLLPKHKAITDTLTGTIVLVVYKPDIENPRAGDWSWEIPPSQEKIERAEITSKQYATIEWYEQPEPYVAIVAVGAIGYLIGQGRQ